MSQDSAWRLRPFIRLGLALIVFAANKDTQITPCALALRLANTHTHMHTWQQNNNKQKIARQGD
jgi:hypothetical protein